jgi:hypothetical protein
MGEPDTSVEELRRWFVQVLLGARQDRDDDIVMVFADYLQDPDSPGFWFEGSQLSRFGIIEQGLVEVLNPDHPCWYSIVLALTTALGQGLLAWAIRSCVEQGWLNDAYSPTGRAKPLIKPRYRQVD